jgi:uncharacterized protein YneF (UPF0154 family)
VVKATRRQHSGISAGIVTILVVIVLGAAGFWFLSTSANKTASLELTPEAREYVRNLKLSDVGMKATESYLKQMVVEIDGKITNIGPRPIDTVDLYCVFYDAYKQIVLRQRVPIVSERSGGLKPQQTKPFRLPFDSLSDNWNHQSPQLVIAGIRFAG